MMENDLLAEVADEMLESRKLVKMRCRNGYDWTSDPFFPVEAMTNPQGLPFFNTEEWNRLVMGMIVVSETSNITGSAINGEMALRFHDPTQADLFRRKLSTDLAADFIVDPVYSEDLEARQVVAEYLATFNQYS